MVDLLVIVFMSWEYEDVVYVVVFFGVGECGFCVGGDVVVVYYSVCKDGVEVWWFWCYEYLFNVLIGWFVKFYVVLMDGIVMGGGVGVSVYVNIWVVIDIFKVVMFEVGIGFIFDVGGVYLLLCVFGVLGLYVVLIGVLFFGVDVIVLGFVDYFVLYGDFDVFM